MSFFKPTAYETSLDIDMDSVADRSIPSIINNDTSAIREGVDESLGILRNVVDELVSGGVIAFDGNVVEALTNLTQYCAISLEMIRRTPL